MTTTLSKSNDVGRHSFVGIANSLHIVDAKFADELDRTPLQQKDSVHMVANKCRAWYEPVFSNESKYLPVSRNAKVTIESIDLGKKETKEDNSWFYLLLLAASGLILYKISE